MLKLLVSKKGMEIENCLFFFLGKFPSLNIRPQIICPSKPATLPTSLKAYEYYPTNTKGQANKSYRNMQINFPNTNHSKKQTRKTKVYVGI